MINSTLLQLISKLDVSEFKEFGEYIRSPFINKNESVVKLYDYIKGFYPDFSEMNSDKEAIYKHLFPDIKYDDGFMRKLMFNLGRLAEDYLVYLNGKSSSVNYSKALLDELLKRDLSKIYLKKLGILKNEIDKQKTKDVEYFKNKFFIDAFQEIIYTQERTLKSVKDKPETFIINNTYSLINYFLVEALQEYRFIITYKDIIRFDFNPDFYEMIMEYVKAHQKEIHEPLISIYYNAVLLIKERDEKYFLKLKAETVKELSSLSLSDKYSTFAILVNFANEQYKKGNKKYLTEAFDLYNLILENKLYGGNKNAPFYNPLFRNIVNVGLLLNKISWTENFIKTYISKLMPEFRKNALHLSKARVSFAKKNYDESLEELSRIESIEYFQIKPVIKSLTLMIYIEKGLYDEAVDLIDAYRHYISYEKLLTDVSKEKNMNFIKTCNEIIRLKTKSTVSKLSDLKYDLIHTENILEKEWLEEKLNSFSKK